MNWSVIILIMVMAIFSNELAKSAKDHNEFSLVDDYITAPVIGLIFLAALLSGLAL